ncbi:hypothetical protein [Celerinatantimonas sp. YJH-8]|uniref:hypothetical protein n=1 Tax=Celerinatantimonas sp. YJH-8 TaxID=3228714 RepID=UPI0038C97A8D
MMIHIEKLLSKYGLDSIRFNDDYENSDASLSLEEQLAAVGIIWDQSCAGFLLLLIQHRSQHYALTDLMHLVFQQAAQQLADEWHGFYPQQAVSALSLAAVKIVIQSHTAACQHCSKDIAQSYLDDGKSTCEGCIHASTFSNEAKFQIFSQQLPMSRACFVQYNAQLDRLIRWLYEQRDSAVLALDEKAGRDRGSISATLVA